MYHRTEQLQAEKTFSYGNHTIQVKVTLSKTEKMSSRVDYGPGGDGFYRTVSVKAFPIDKKDAKFDAHKSTTCRVRPEPVYPDWDVDASLSVSLLGRIRAFLTDMTLDQVRELRRRSLQEKWNREFTPSGGEVSIETQIRETAKPILEALDQQYKVTAVDMDVDVEVSVERMAAETSWVEVKDGINRLSDEINTLAEGS